MNKKIYACIIFSFVVSFGLLLIIQNHFQDELVPKGSEFYSQDFSLENDLIFLIGSSNVGQLNTTLIHEKVSQKFPHHTVYNLAYNGDMPSERIKTVDEIIKLNPKIILYGITYRDFEVDSKEKQPLFDPQQFFTDLITNEIGIDNKINPKFTTLEIIRKTFSDTGLFPPRELIRFDNSPFFVFTSEQTTLANEIELKQQGDNQKPINIGSIIENKHVSDLNLIIEKFQKNKITVIIISTPLHQYSLDQISLETKANFSGILEKIRNIYDVKIYNFSEKYASEDIWANVSHVSYNKKSNIYSDDITDIIITELDR
jgi:hypothetical protein